MWFYLRSHNSMLVSLSVLASALKSRIAHWHHWYLHKSVGLVLFSKKSVAKYVSTSFYGCFEVVTKAIKTGTTQMIRRKENLRIEIATCEEGMCPILSTWVIVQIDFLSNTGQGKS